MFSSGISRVGVYLCLRGVWRESVYVLLGLVKGMWNLKVRQTRVQILPLSLTSFTILEE